MGGDRGPRCIVSAALRSLSLYPSLHITLVGAADSIEPLLTPADLASGRIALRPAREQILADDPPASVLRASAMRPCALRCSWCAMVRWMAV
ncbi:hypothetical protein ULG90_07695 [Halopseudomonas pachastrellae]|nr:hypothetical protein ULG90_07695 [Halopseudomonas pachastrellae]